MIKSLTVVIAALAVPVITAGAAFASTPGLKQVRDPRHVTGTIHGRCYFRDKTELPDPRCTPGSIDPIVTQANLRSTICKAGWTDPHLRPPESQTEWFKRYRAFPAYGLTWYRESELDHLVPLELGGSNDATNLWPELGKPSGNPKDKVENALNRAVCSGRVSLARAQAAIAYDWMTAEKRLGLTSTGRGHRHPPARGAPPARRPRTTAGLATTTCPSAPTSPTATPRRPVRPIRTATRPTARAQRLSTSGTSRPARTSP